jgi:Holliday junction resolvase
MEKNIQSSIRDHLRQNGWLVIKLVVTSMFGVPDLLCIKGGKVVFIEVKQPGKKPTALQVATHIKLTGHGVQVLIATSVNDIRGML